MREEVPPRLPSSKRKLGTRIANLEGEAPSVQRGWKNFRTAALRALSPHWDPAPLTQIQPAPARAAQWKCNQTVQENMLFRTKPYGDIRSENEIEWCYIA